MDNKKNADVNIAVIQRSMERIMIGITKRDKWTNRKVRQTTKTIDAVQFCMKLKWNWAGHIARRQDGRWTKRLTEWTPRNGQRGRGRPA